MSWVDRYEQFREQIRDKSDCREVAEELGVDVNGSGLAVCVFHQDNDPSMSVNSWGGKCFGCEKTFDVFTIVEQLRNCSFLDAVHFLAKRAGIEVPGHEGDEEEYQEELRKISERKKIEDILSDSFAFMHRCLPSKYRRHLRNVYGLDDQTIDKLQIGWSDAAALELFLVDGLGYEPKDLASSGLFFAFSDNKVRGIFDRRIVAPYLVRGRAVYGIGRRTEDSTDEDFELAKYKKLLTKTEKHPYVSPAVENSWLYGEDSLRQAGDHALITEGLFDCAALIMLGYKVISPVTVQARKKDTPRLVALTRKVSRVTIVNDNENNESGAKGAIAMGNALHLAGKHVYIATIPKSEDVNKIDVCDLVSGLKAKLRDEGIAEEELNKKVRAEVDSIVAKAKPYIEFLAESLARNVSPGELSDQLKPVFELIAACPPVERDSYIKKLAKSLDLARSTIRESVKPFLPEETRDQQKPESGFPSLFADEEKVRGRVFEDADHYYISGKISDEKISSFVVIGKELISTEQGALINTAVRIRGFDHDLSHTFPIRAWGSRREFVREALSIHPACQFTGNDDNVQGVLQCIGVERLPVRRGTHAVGLVKTDNGLRWLSSEGTIGPEGLEEEDSGEGVLFIPSGSPIQKHLKYRFEDQDYSQKVCAKVLPKIIDLNSSSVVLPILGFTIASMLKPLFFEELGHFPILFVWGTQGSGKTSIIRDVFWRLTGVKSEPFSCTDSDFAKAKNLSGSTSVPVFYDEFKSDIGKHRVLAWHRTLRRAYNGENESRGRADQSVVEYKLQAPIIVAGESRPDDDPALTERLICVNPDKNGITSERKHIFLEVSNSPLDVVAAELVKFVLSIDFKSLVIRARAATDELLNQTRKNVPIRCYDSLLVMIAGLLIYEDFAEHKTIALPEVDYVTAFRSVVDELLEGGDGNVKDAFDSFLESCSTYAHLGVLREGIHYSLDDDILNMHLPSCHKVYLDERKKSGFDDGTNGLRSLKRVIREKKSSGSYVVHDRIRTEVGTYPVFCVQIDQGKVPAALDFERFPNNAGGRKAATWGSWGSDQGDTETTEPN